jgi:ATPase subunit of ABC transporter with duplicated ATPase domains
MPQFARLDDVALSRPDGERLFSGLSFVVGEGATGLVGRNGCGKSSLLRVLADPTLPHEGQVSLNGTASLVGQSIDPAHETIADVLGVTASLAVLARMAAGAGTVEDAAGADWTLETRLEAAMSKTGLTGWAPNRPVTALSGGERMRLMIARALLEDPDLLLLDEPTNNMDAEGREVVHDLLLTFRGGIVVASHDRDLLDRVDRIVELTPQGVHLTVGGWTTHAEARAQRLARAEIVLDRAEARVVDVVDAARDRAEKQARRDAKGRRNRRSGGDPKMLLDKRQDRAEGTAGQGRRLAERQRAEAEDALAAARTEVERERPMSFALPPCGLPSGRQVLSVDGLTIRHGAGPVIGPVSFSITGPERVEVSGPNGAGKSTILRAIAASGAGAEGAVASSVPAPPVLDQHQSLLRDGQTLRENLQRVQPSLPRNAVHAMLARFAFRNADADRTAGSLSGGERLRAALACVFSSDPPPVLLILDEPTNHLDIAAVEELEAALAAYDGAILVVSHDRDFLDRIGVGKRVEVRRPDDRRRQEA